jgi:ABC-2 type transport system permease protein
MITSIIRASFAMLRRDRAAFIMSFVLPVAFFSIFGIIFGGNKTSSTPKMRVIVVDEDKSAASQRLVQGLIQEASLDVAVRPATGKNGPPADDYTAASAEAAVKMGDYPSALVIPKGFGEHPIAFVGGAQGDPVLILHDSSDPVAAPMVSGMLQKTVMTSLTDVMAGQGMKIFESAAGGLAPEQKERLDEMMQAWHRANEEKKPANSENGGSKAEMNLVNFKVRDVVGEHKQAPMISFYAAGIGVMFLLFTATSAGGSLLEEAESGSLERVLCSQVGMTTLLLGKLAFNALLASMQLLVMFVWAMLVFHLDLLSHLPGFVVMTVSTAVAVSAFGILLASLSRTRAQLSSIGTLLILTMSAIGGSMFPRFLMPEVMQKIGLFTFNAWSIDGFTKVFWRDEPVAHLWPQVAFLVGAATILFLIARRVARRWESA